MKHNFSVRNENVCEANSRRGRPLPVATTSGARNFRSMKVQEKEAEMRSSLFIFLCVCVCYVWKRNSFCDPLESKKKTLEVFYFIFCVCLPFVPFAFRLPFFIFYMYFICSKGGKQRQRQRQQQQKNDENANHWIHRQTRPSCSVSRSTKHSRLWQPSSGNNVRYFNVMLMVYEKPYCSWKLKAKEERGKNNGQTKWMLQNVNSTGAGAHRASERIVDPAVSWVRCGTRVCLS